MLTEADLVVALLSAGAGYGVGFAIFRLKERALRAELSAQEREQEDKLRRNAEAAQLSAKVAAQEQLARDRAELEKSLAAQRDAIATDEHRVAERESLVNRQMDRLALQESDARVRSEQVEISRGELERERMDLRRLAADCKARMEQVSGLDSASARTLLLKEIERESSKDAADLSRHILDDARHRSEEQARRILATALQRYAATHTFETTTATVALTGDDMKGRIIGREGRNIRAFEAATGVTVLVDDTPNAVVLSGFDPVRREVARQSMERLILDGRIHPTRIEEVVAAVTTEMEGFIQRTGEDAVFRTGLSPLNPEVAKTLGKLHFRHSYSQNVLEHSIEVAHLCGLMAAEMGENIQAAKRAGLLHDIGKAMTHEIEGPHALVGADFLKRHGEPPDIVNGVASHHQEVAHENLYGILVAAADAISASRPGSRSESMTTYIKRLENLEQIALSFPGVEKAFAVQAGRELRVVVRPEQVDDSTSLLLARQLARKIEDELLYPGQIRITVIRETRCVEFAK
ncbi:MAG TPA: ribonuclease Y [Candidatus Limnocylindria bacterium]|nr:ribonuclease Y [Candidatus Limnocylindria bacterium]